MASNTLTVSTQKELLSALKTAKGGETILLEDGNYGAVQVSRLYQKTIGDYDSPVTIKSVNPHGATFSSLEMRYARNVSLDGIEVDGTLKVWMSPSDIKITNTKAEYMYLRDIDGLSLTNSEAGGGQFGVHLQGVKNFDISHNTFHNVTEDVVRIVGNSHSGTFANNVLSDVIAAKGIHPDLLQMFAMDGASPHDIVIENNLFYDDASTGKVIAQGIFMWDPVASGYKNITIQENLFLTEHLNTIYVKNGSSGVEILNNTLMGEQWGYGGTIRLVSGAGSSAGVTVEGNLARGVLNDDGDATVLDNHFYGSGNYLTVKAPMSEIFANPDASDWTAFIATKTSNIARTNGASDFVAELLAKTETLGIQATKENQPLLDPTYEYKNTSSFVGVWNSTVIEKDDPALHIDEGTLALTFNADTFSWKRGLFSKDAKGTDNGFSAWIDNGVLKVTFEDDTGSKTVTSTAISVHTDHTLQVSFGDGDGDVWLDGKMIGSVKTDMDWSDNHEKIMVGGYNGNSASGTTDGRLYVFDGDIDHLAIYDDAFTPEQLSLLT